jgi:mevalonate kinase
VEVALKAGALGAKLTGGGMGGCIIALAKDMKDAENIGAELQNKGAKTVWYFKTGSSQVYQIKC